MIIYINLTDIYIYIDISVCQVFNNFKRKNYHENNSSVDNLFMLSLLFCAMSLSMILRLGHIDNYALLPDDVVQNSISL